MRKSTSAKNWVIATLPEPNKEQKTKKNHPDSWLPVVIFFKLKNNLVLQLQCEPSNNRRKRGRLLLPPAPSFAKCFFSGNTNNVLAIPVDFWIIGVYYGESAHWYSSWILRKASPHTGLTTGLYFQHLCCKSLVKYCVWDTH